MTHAFFPALPEIFLLVMVCVIMLVDLFLKPAQRGVTYALSQLTVIVLAAMTWPFVHDKAITLFHGQFVLDHFAVVLKLFMYLMVFAIFLYSRRYVMERQIMRGEFHLLTLIALLGGMVLVSANSLLTLYLGLELLSLPTYAMVAMQRDASKGPEAAMKYFVMGAVASAMMLYGMSFVFGLSGSLLLPEISHVVLNGMSHSMLFIFALMFFIVGVCFKLGAVPFHMWVPDVYEGSPTCVTAILGTLSKIAALGLIVRLVIQMMHGLLPHWHIALMVIAVLSILLGNILAIVQTNIKRMFAYSTISHMGFIVLVLALGTKQSLTYAVFYTVVYVIMSVGGFGMVMLLARQGHESDKISDFAGLNKRHAWIAFMMLLLMVSMAGIPPMVGFDAKLFVIQALIAQHYYGLAIFALIMSVIGAYYYLRVVKVMYFDAAEPATLKHPLSLDGRIAVSVNGVLVLLLGLMPAGLLALCAF